MKFFNKIKTYFIDTYNELVHKVTWPKRADLQTSAVVVMVASLIFAVVVFAMDISFKNLMELIYGMFY
jgi:preprotein translocase subunit SecE